MRRDDLLATAAGMVPADCHEALAGVVRVYRRNIARPRGSFAEVRDSLAARIGVARDLAREIDADTRALQSLLPRVGWSRERAEALTWKSDRTISQLEEFTVAMNAAVAALPVSRSPKCVRDYLHGDPVWQLCLACHNIYCRGRACANIGHGNTEDFVTFTSLVYEAATGNNGTPIGRPCLTIARYWRKANRAQLAAENS